MPDDYSFNDDYQIPTVAPVNSDYDMQAVVQSPPKDDYQFAFDYEAPSAPPVSGDYQMPNVAPVNDYSSIQKPPVQDYQEPLEYTDLTFEEPEQMIDEFEKNQGAINKMHQLLKGGSGKLND